TVTAALVNHPVEAYGFRIEYGGRSIAYSGDTGECTELVKLATDADMLLCEASLLDKPDLPTGLHLSGRPAAEHAAEAGAGRRAPTRRVAWTDPSAGRDDATRGGFTGPIELARRGAAYGLA